MGFGCFLRAKTCGHGHTSHPRNRAWVTNSLRGGTAQGVERFDTRPEVESSGATLTQLGVTFSSMARPPLWQRFLAALRPRNSDLLSPGDVRGYYFSLLKLDPSSRADEKKREAALKRAHELRSFEIEHYWKRATYFWAFQVAIFAAFGLIKPNDTFSEWGPVPLLLSGLGVLTAVANMLSARGSKFWQANWVHGPR